MSREAHARFCESARGKLPRATLLFSQRHWIWVRIDADCFFLISPANIGPNLFHQARTVSWQISIPRSWSRSSTCRNDRGKRTYIITARRITSGEVLKYRNGFFIHGRYETLLAASS